MQPDWFDGILPEERDRARGEREEDVVMKSLPSVFIRSTLVLTTAAGLQEVTSVCLLGF